MATRTIANGGGIWTTGSTWVEGVAPTAADDVVATATSGNVTVSTSGLCRSLDLTNYVGIISINSSRLITVGDATAGVGNVALKIPATASFTLGSTTTSKIVFASTSTTVQTITTNGVTGLPTLNWQGAIGAKYKFTDNYTAIAAGGFSLVDGEIDLNGKTLTCSNGVFNISGTNARAFICTNSTVQCGTWTATTITSLTQTGGSSFNVTITGGSTTSFNGGGLTYNTITHNSTGTFTLVAAANIITLLTNTNTGGFTLSGAGSTITTLTTTSSTSTTLTISTAQSISNLNIGHTGNTAISATQTSLGAVTMNSPGTLTFSSAPNSPSSLTNTTGAITISTAGCTMPTISMPSGYSLTVSASAGTTTFSGGVTLNGSALLTTSSTGAIAFGTNSPLTTGSSGTSTISNTGGLSFSGGAPVIVVSNGSTLTISGTASGTIPAITVSSGGSLLITKSWTITTLTNNGALTIQTTANSGITTYTGTGTVTASVATTITTVTLTGSGASWAQSAGILTITTLNLNNVGNTTGLQLTTSTTHVIGIITTNSSLSNGNVFIRSSTATTTATISMSGTTTTDSLIIRDITRSGAGSWTTTNSLSYSNNSGITFSTTLPQLIAQQSGNITASNVFALCDTTCVADSLTPTITSITATVTSGNTTPGIQTIDGIALRIASRVVSPTGTLIVTFRNTTISSDVTSITVNVSDLALVGGWHFFKFSAPQVTLAANTYATKADCSVSGEVAVLCVGATDLIRRYRTTTTAALSSFAIPHILNELTGAGTSNSITVTMNANWQGCLGRPSALVTQGFVVDGGGTLTCGTSVSTTYALSVWGYMFVYSGTIQFGTTGMPVPATSTATLTFCQWVNTTDSFLLGYGGTFSFVGVPPTAYQTTLTVNAAAGQANITVGSTSGWVVGDAIGIASTTSTNSQMERMTILSIGSSTTATLTTNLTYAHSGTTPAIAEVVHLTRNVKIKSTANGSGEVRINGNVTATFTACEFTYIGSSNGSLTMDTTGSVTIDKCAFSLIATGVSCFYTSSSFTGTFSVTNTNVMITTPSTAGVTHAAASGTWTYTGNVFIGTVCSFSDVGGVFQNNSVSSASGVGISIQENATLGGAWTDNTVHSCSSAGVQILLLLSGQPTVSFNSWLNGLYGIYLAVAAQQYLTFSGGFVWGNGNMGFLIDSSPSTPATCGTTLTLKSMTFAGNGTQPVGFYVQSGAIQPVIFLDSCVFGILAGLGTQTHATSDIYHAGVGKIYTRNTKLASATMVSGIAGVPQLVQVLAEKHNQIAGDHRRWELYGTGKTDTTIYRTASPAAQLTPLNASNKFFSSLARINAANGATPTISVYIYKSAAYNGNQPRLILVANPAVGFTDDTVLATASGGTGSWIQLTANLPNALTDDGAFEVYVDCDGTAGTVNISDWSFLNLGTVDSLRPLNWHNGMANIYPATTNSGSVFGGNRFRSR